MPRVRSLVAVAAVALTLAGCSSDGDDGPVGPEVSRDQLDDDWPLTVDGGTMLCEAANARTDAILFRADDGTTYAVDGAALAFTGYRSIADFQGSDDEGATSSLKGLVEMGLAQCPTSTAGS